VQLHRPRTGTPILFDFKSHNRQMILLYPVETSVHLTLLLLSANKHLRKYNSQCKKSANAAIYSHLEPPLK
jgi:hypothetical protein